MQLAGPFYKKYAVAAAAEKRIEQRAKSKEKPTLFLFSLLFFLFSFSQRRLPPSVNIGFQVLFHSPPGVLFTFPSQYLFSIGRLVVFSLTGWSPHVQSGFLVSRPTLDTTGCYWFSNTGLSPSMACFPKTVLLTSCNAVCGPNPC